MTLKNLQVDDSIEEEVKAVHDAFEDASETVVGRRDIFDLLMVSFISRSHMLLNGGPGLGKSMIASAAFSVFEPDTVKLYNKMMMAGTLPEEVFGPMNMKAFREDAEITFNTEGMLPWADFAFIDEVYRGPDSILGACLNIFNERIFVNGPTVQKCPLNSVIGTTNFVSDTPILEAFRDRWLFSYDLVPLDSASERLSMLKLVYSPKKKSQRRLRLADLKSIQKYVAAAPYDEKLADLYENVVSKFRKAIAGRTISDRRYAQGFQVVRVGSIINPDDLSSSFARLRHVLPVGDVETNSFDTIFQTEIQSLSVRAEEEPRLKDLEQTAVKIRRVFDPSMKTSKLKDTIDAIDSFLEEDPDSGPALFSISEFAARQRVAVETLKTVRLSAVQELEKRMAKAAAKSDKTTNDSSPKSLLSDADDPSVEGLEIMFGKTGKQK